MTAVLVGRHTRTPVGHFTAFAGDLNADLPTCRLWLPMLDEVDAILERTDEEPADEEPPPSGSWAPITPELLHAVEAGLSRLLREGEQRRD